MPIRNIVSNFAGQVWTGAMGLVFIPFYVRYLGVESIGLLGFFAMLQSCLGILDLGMTPTLNREMARPVTGPARAQSLRDTLRSFEVISLAAGFVAAGTGSVIAVWLATRWLNADRLPVDVVARAIQFMFVVVALRFLESIYHGALLGLQRQGIYNAILALVATLRHAGAVLVLAFASSTITAYFAWQIGCSVASVVILAERVNRYAPSAPRPGRFSINALRSVGRFSAGMLGVSVLALLLTQTDKILLSRLLTLEAFGWYSLASTVAGVLYLAVQPVVQAIFPQLVANAENHDPARMKEIYHFGAQLVTTLTAGAAAICIAFGGVVIFAWTGDPLLAANVAPLLSVLAIGTFINGLMYMPYHLQIAHGWTSLSLKTNLVSVVVLIPAIFLVVPRYGAVGAAWIWTILNCSYFTIVLTIMHRRLLVGDQRKWYLNDVLAPLLPVVGIAALARAIHPATIEGRWQQALFLACVLFLTAVASSAVADKIRIATLARIDGAIRVRSS